MPEAGVDSLLVYVLTGGGGRTRSRSFGSIFRARAIFSRIVRSARPILAPTSAAKDATALPAVALPIVSFAATAPAV